MKKPLALFLAATFLAGSPAAAQETVRVACVGDSITFGAGVEDREKNAAKETKTEVIDLYQALSGKPELFPDKVHPNAAGANVIAETVHRALAKSGVTRH